jgi:hypothetical protein
MKWAGKGPGERYGGGHDQDHGASARERARALGVSRQRLLEEVLGAAGATLAAPIPRARKSRDAASTMFRRVSAACSRDRRISGSRSTRNRFRRERSNSDAGMNPRRAASVRSAADLVPELRVRMSDSRGAGFGHELGVIAATHARVDAGAETLESRRVVLDRVCRAGRVLWPTSSSCTPARSESPGYVSPSPARRTTRGSFQPWHRQFSRWGVQP